MITERFRAKKALRFELIDNCNGCSHAISTFVLGERLLELATLFVIDAHHLHRLSICVTNRTKIQKTYMFNPSLISCAHASSIAN